MLPRKDGFTLAKEIRTENSEVPILFLTAKSMKHDRIKGFKIGGDDYITKPFAIEELILRIEVFLKRSVTRVNNRGSYKIGSFNVDCKNLELVRGDVTQRLTQKEAEVLELLASHPNEVLDRSYILKSVWGDDDYFLGRSLDVFISRLRKYLKADSTIEIRNSHGIGFKLVTE